MNEVWPEASPLDQQNVCSTKCAESPFYSIKKKRGSLVPPRLLSRGRSSHADVGTSALAAPLGPRRAILPEVAPIAPPILSIMGNITAIAPEVPTIRAHVLPILLEPHSTGP